MNHKLLFMSLSAALALGAVTTAAVAAPSSAHAPEKQASEAAQFAAGEPGAPNKPFRVVEVAMIEGSGTVNFSPNRIAVKMGEQIKFVITNKGALEHEFKLDSIERIAKHKIAMEKNPEMVHDEPNGTSLEPGKSAEILWKFSQAGTYEFACLVPGHYEAGMHGTVIVK